MKLRRFTRLTLLTPALLLHQTPLQAQERAAPPDPWNQAAMAWVGLLKEGAFDSAAVRVDSAVPAGSLDAAALRQIWSQVCAQLGALVSVSPGPVVEQATYHIVDMPARFEAQEMTVRVVLTDDLHVSGFFFRPPSPPAYEAPDYVDRSRFQEKSVTVGQSPWQLPGTFSVPVGAGPFPAVVLVHGSGPNDQDESIGGNRPFRDLAWGLASREIAVLRYDKRTRVYPGRLSPDITVEEEVVTDALAALASARSDPRVDAGQVFLLGHSLGSMVAPEIARRDGKVAGLILLAAPARPFAEVLRDQLEYGASLEEGSNPEARAQTDSLLRLLKDYEAGTLPAGTQVLGASAGYLRSLDALHPVRTTANLRLPVLVLQGGRDYQVTEKDFRLWKEGLEADPEATLREYPDLNHLFAAGKGIATPSEYMTQVKHVAPEVIGDVSTWISRVPRAR